MMEGIRIFQTLSKHSISIISKAIYAGFAFNFVLAFFAELSASDPEVKSYTLALLFLSVSDALRGRVEQT